MSYYYFCMRSTLDLYVSDKLEAQKKPLKVYFAILLAGYAIRLVYAVGIGFYDELIC